MFYCEICEIFENTRFEDHLQMTASILRGRFLDTKAKTRRIAFNTLKVL